MTGIRTDLYNLFKSNGFIIQLYDVDGNGPTLAIEESEYIFSKKGSETYMAVIEDGSSRLYNRVTIYKTSETSPKDFREMLTNFKRIVAKNAYTMTIKNFGNKITPKDFSVLPKLNKVNEPEELEESFEVKGFSKTSHFTKDNAKVIVKHKDKIDSKKVNANSRGIHDIWVATSDGERRKIGSRNLTLGKAIANHINHGGSLYDDVTNKLIQIGEDLDKVRSFKADKKADPEKVAAVKSLISETTSIMKNFLKKMSTRKKVIFTKELPDYNVPEKSFTKAFYADLCDNDTAERLARISIFNAFMK